MNVYSPVTIDSFPNLHAGRRKRNENLVIFIVIFLFVFIFSALAWYFHTKPTVEQSRCGKRLVGYYRGWGGREVSEGQIVKLTHVIYSSAVMHSNGKITFGSKTREESFLKLRAMAKKVNRNLKVLVAIGGGSQKSLDFLVEADVNKTFENAITSFITNYRIDGVELQWKHYSGHEAADQLQVVQNLKKALVNFSTLQNRSDPYLLTLSLPNKEWPSHNGISLDEVLEQVDFVNVASFDYSLPPGPFAPLYSRNTTNETKNVDYTMKNLACQTKQWKKINKGLGFFGRSWKNVLDPIRNLNETTWKSETSMIRGDTVQWRNLRMKGSENNYWDSEKKEYVAYENVRSLIEKANYVMEKNLGGMAISMLDFDDNEDTLLNAVASVDVCNGRRKRTEKRELKCDKVLVEI